MLHCPAEHQIIDSFNVLVEEISSSLINAVISVSLETGSGGKLLRNLSCF
jgi:hypothetical protein